MQKTITHSCRPWLWQALISVMLTTMSFGTVFAQEKQLFVRVAKIVIDSAHIEEYNAALREGMEAAVSKEPGVLTLYAVYDKGHPTHVTVFEIYADAEAYRAHMETPHFKK